MNLIEKLTPEELQAFTSYCIKHAEGDGAQASPQHILRFWAEEKKDLFNIFGEQLILTKSISYKKDFDEIRDDINNTLTGSVFWQEFCDFMHPYYHTDYSLYLKLSCLINSNEYRYTNIYNGESFELKASEKTLSIKKGCKVSKILGKIASAFGLKGYEDYRIKHSQCLNQKNLNGEICLSIHPLDYLTMSDNNCGWVSCMSWCNQGDFRQGTVEMMNSPFVVVAYLKSSVSDYSMGNGFLWNNKKWRQLYIVDKNIISGVKEYPYHNSMLDHCCLNWLRELAENSGFGHYHPNICTVEPYETNNIPFSSGSVYIDIQPNGAMYNDYEVVDHNVFLSPDVPETISIDYSGESECMCCGNAFYVEDGSGTNLLTCYDCNSMPRCDYCRDIIRSNEVYGIDSMLLCEDCYENYSTSCECCGGIFLVDSLERYYLNYNNTNLKALGALEVCSECAKQIKGFHSYYIVFEELNKDDQETILELFGATLKDLEELYQQEVDFLKKM